MDLIDGLVRILRDSRNAVFFGGAGMATESDLSNSYNEDGYIVKFTFDRETGQYHYKGCGFKETDLRKWGIRQRV